MHLYFVTVTLSLTMIASLPATFGTAFNYMANIQSAQIQSKSLLVIIENTRVSAGQFDGDERNIADRGVFQVCRIDASTPSGERIAAAYGVTEFPFAVVADPFGKIVYRGTEMLHPKPDSQPAANQAGPATTSARASATEISQTPPKELAEQPVFQPAELADALQTARDAQRMLAVFVTTRSCHYCIKMKREALSDPEVQSTVAERYASAKIDGDQCPDFIEQHGVRLFPTVLVLTSQGQLVDRIEGYVTADQLTSRLRQATSSLVSQY